MRRCAWSRRAGALRPTAQQHCFCLLSLSTTEENLCCSSENFEDDEMETYLERMVEENMLMMVRDKLFFV